VNGMWALLKVDDCHQDRWQLGLHSNYPLIQTAP